MSANDVTHRSQGHTTDPAIEAIIGDHAGWAGGLMPALHAVQHHAGFVDRGYIPLLAHTFNLSVAEVHGVISFYKDFRTVAPKGPVVQVCRAEACIARGGKPVIPAFAIGRVEVIAAAVFARRGGGFDAGCPGCLQ